MISINKDNVQVKYITGINKCLPNYPTPLDVLYESCMESSDENIFSQDKMSKRYGIEPEQIEDITKTLLDKGYIKKNNNRYKIVKTPWD